MPLAEDNPEAAHWKAEADALASRVTALEKKLSQERVARLSAEAGLAWYIANNVRFGR